MTTAIFNRINNLMIERAELKGILPYEYLGFAYSNSQYGHCEHYVPKNGELQRLVRDTIEKRIAKITEEIKALGLVEE